MKIAFCLKTDSKDSELDDRFGRAEYYGIIDSETGNTFEIFENTARKESSGAGASAVQLLVNKGAEAVIAPEFGPKAFDALNRFSIKLFKQGDHKKVDSAMEDWRTGKLASPAAPGRGGLHKA